MMGTSPVSTPSFSKRSTCCRGFLGRLFLFIPPINAIRMQCTCGVPMVAGLLCDGDAMVLHRCGPWPSASTNARPRFCLAHFNKLTPTSLCVCSG